MAERPLYTLYKNLKAQNYDVPDDYNKFESALTRDGKGGADNRHAIYENLKDQNFDVPSTYERFYSALFEPRSKTSSRAKGGSVPMSAADRARFSAGAAAISASAQQTMNNAGRYNRLKQRKQKQQKDFGRVNLGTHQTPYGGDANNVVKDDFAYNPETGKTGAYVTSDNENVYSLPEAEQKQAILDQQNNAYQVAVDTGEIPSAFDVRDKNGNYDLQENIGKNGTYLTEEGAQKQFDKKLADAYARKKEIEALIAEDNRQHGNPLLSYGASIGAGNGRTAEQSDYRNKLATSLSLVTEQIGALEAVKQYPTSSWGEDALKALDNTAFTAKTWDFGLTDFAIMGQMERIKTKMDNNIPLSGSDKMLLKSKLGADAATALEDDKMGNVYRWTKIAGQNLPFMADFFLTGGYGGITKGISRGALKFAAKRGMGKVSAAILKNTGIVAGDVIGSYAMAGTEQALKTGADIMQRHLGNLYQDEKGDYKFGTFDENGNLLHEGGESIGTALYKGMTSAMVENYTEKLFGHNYGIKKGAVNFMEKHGMNASAEFFKNIGKSGWYTNSKKWMEKFGINGFAEEVMEEEIGIPLHAMLDGEGKVSDILDARQQLDIIGGMAISVGSMYATGAGSRPVKGIYNRAQYYRFRNKVNVADIDAQNLMGDNWADIKDKIDNATNEQMGGVLADILRQRDTMTKEQINAAVNYGINLMKMRGYNIAKTAEMNAKEITNEPTTPEEQHQADIDNAYSEGHDADDADKHDIQIQQEDQMKTLAAALGISEQQLSAMSDEELESMTGQDDKLDQAIYDYQLSSARYQGVVDDAQDKVDLAAHQAEQRVDMYTDQSRGSVRNATIKASGGLEDYGVYIISGNIATHDDGSIDVGNRDDMILYFDPTTNSVEHADAVMFAELGEELPADDVKAQAVSDAKENAIKEVAGIIDGTVEVGSQFNVTDTDGTEHTYEVLADYGDGTAAISIDGNVVDNPYSLADLQQMKDLEDQKRLEAAKAEREQMEKEREAQQTQNIEETQPSFDFNQILNDNGNVVLADVLGKDGNTKYPNSQLFLIRDSGAKAKVMELTSDGSLIPHAVNKKDVRTATTMTLDEYKQAFAESSMVEDHSGENRGEIEVETPTIEVETPTIEGETAAPADETAAPADETAAPESAETPETEQTPAAPAITLEDGTIVPMLEDGNPDFSKLTAAQTAELYDNQFGEDADSIVSGYVSDAKKALDKASNMTVRGKTFVEQKAAKDAKEKAIADAQAAYDSAIAIRDAYNERQLAKVEDTAEGRKELIEKARRKFARLKSAVKDDAEAVSQLYRETIGSLLHRLYDGTGIDVTDTIPLTAEEYVASNLGAHSLNYEGTETSKGVKQETGLSREDFAKTQLLAADGKGTTIDALVHSLWENRPSNLESLDTQDIRNALISVLNSGFKASEARNFVKNIRIAQAENILEEQKRAQENAAYAEQHKAEQEAELKAKSDEKAELKAKSEAKLDNESDNKSNDLSNESDNEKINDNINDNINVPEDATDEAPLGAQRDESDLPFSAKENGKQQTTADRAADVEKNKVDDMKVVDNIVGEKTRKAFERLSKMMGATIQWQYSDKLGNGWIQETTDADGNVHRTIFITLDSSITEGAQFIFGHEMTHQIKNLNPAAYNELTQLVLDTYGSDAFDKAVDETMQRYSDAGFSGRAREYYAEEVVADSVGEMIRDLNLAHTLAMKMSHPLLAAIHEILQKIKLAFFGTEYSDVTKNIIRSIEQAYVKTANGEVTNSETGEDVSFSLRQKPEPKKKGVGYKVFVLKDGKLYPPMVANPDGAATPVGVWLDADAAPIAGESKTGRPQVKQGGKGTQGGSGKLAYRPGWHLGVVPYAIQFNRKDAEGNKTLFPENFVFAEVEYAADVDYQEEARQEGINPSGKYQHSLAGLKHLPTDGYYMYRTNPNPETDPWVITGAMKVNRILTRAEQAELVKNAGREPQQIQEGDIVTDDVVNSINQEIADAPKFSLKDNQENPLNQDGTLKLDKIKSVDELTDEDFTSAFRNVELPAIPKNVDAAIGANGKPIVIKKNIFEKNWNAHKFTPAESKKVLNDALYNTDLVGHTQPTKKPNHWVAIKLDDKSPITVLEVNDNKNNVEVVGWYTLDEINLGRIKRQAERNGGELIMLTPKDDKVESLSTPPLSSAAKIDNSSETAKENGEKFSLKNEKTMFGMHNISVDKLRKAIKQGGFAAPSMGVVDSKNGIYSDYGEITLIPKAEKLAKRTGKNAGTFTADAWTPTYPQVERIMNKQGEKAFNTDMNVKLGDVDNGIYSNVRESWKEYLSSGDVRDGLYWHYLFDNDMNPETIYQTGKYDNDITNEVMRISDNGNKTDYTDKEVAELIQLMNKATGKDNDVDAQREKLKARIASAEKQGNHWLVALKKKRLEELEGVENFYIAADFVNDVVRNNRKNGKVDVHDTMGTAKKKVEDNKKLSDDFPSWLDKKTEEYGVEEMLYNGTTPGGKPKYIPNTIENAVKLMKKQGVAGGYTAFGSELGVFIAKNSPEVNTLAAMKNAKDKLIPFGDERHNQIKDKITKEFFELSDEIRVGSNNRYAFDDSGVSRMVELTDHKGNEKEYLKKAYNIEVSDEWMDRYNKLLDTIKKDYKVFYFETKFMRPYGLDEFEKAIVPSDTPSDVIDALKKAGIDVSSYERGNAEDRQKVTMDAINSSDNIRFSLAGERGAAAADKKMIHIAQDLGENRKAEIAGEEPKFSLKDGTLIKAGTYFSGGGLVEEGDYNYVIFDENNANIVGNTRFSLRYDQFEHDLNQWKKDNNLPKDAQRPTIPQRNAGESAVDFLRRVDEYRKQMALWKTAPTYEQHLLSDDTALGEFNRELQKGSVLKRIAFQDSMLAIRKAQEAIMKEVGVDRLNMAEDAYTAENRSHGKGKNEFEEYNNEFLQPLRKAYHQMKKILGDSYDNVRIYMMAKHGLERDAQMAFRKSLDADFEDVAQRSAAYNAYKGDMNRIINDSDLEFGRVDFTTWRQRDNALRVKYSPSYMDYRYDKNGIAYDYSGLSALFDGSDFEEDAYKLVKDIEDKYVTETHNLWDATNAATKKILRDGYKAGMMSKDTYQYVRDMYSHYIPLRGWDGTTADQVWDYIGGGKGAFNQTLKKAHGRTSIADDPIAYIENMAESGILLNNKNWVKQHLMLLAQNHPTSLLTLSKAWYVKSTDANGNDEWIPATPQISSQMNSNQVKAAIDAFEKKMEQMAQTGDATQKRDGLNIAYPQTHSEEREHEVRVMKDGEEYVIYVNGDPQLVQAMNNTRAHRVSEGIKNSISKRVIAVVGRKMAAAYTSSSPLFIPSNYFRDLTMTLASTAIREDAKYNYLLRKNLATSWNLGFMLRDFQNGKLRDKVNNGNATPKEQMFYDFMMNGGETGFVSSLDVEDLKKKFKNDLKDLDRWKANPVKVGHTIMDSIEFLNRSIEDSNRFAVYMTSIQYGRSIDEAVNDAKNVTLNFNRKGTGEHSWQTIRNLYLFINPAVQSLQTLGALAKHHPFKFTAVTASWLASGVLVPIVNVALMQLGAAFLGGDGDDDKDWYKDISKKYWQFSKWDRRNNFIMWVPTTHEFVKIPLAQEFRAFYGLGDMIASKMMGGELAEESWEDYGWDLVGQVVDMLPLDPTGYDGNIAVSLMPNAIRPVFELAFNVDFTGKPLFKDTEYNKYDPNFTKAYVGTPDWLVRVSKMVNSIGNDYPDVQQNSIDAFGDPRYNLNNPAVVDHVLSSYLGGAYTMGSQILGVLTKSLNDPKEIKVADIPLVSKFVSNPDDRPVTKKQGDEFWDMKENHDRAANTLSKLKKQAKVDGDYSMLERFYGSEEYKQYKQDDVKVKKYEEDKKKERAEESGEEYRPHKLNAEDIYKSHATPKDDFEDLKLKQLYTKLNGFKTSYDLLVDTAPSQSDGYYNTNKAAIDAIDEISLDKQEISELKKGFLDDGKDAYNAEDMKQIRELRKKILAVLEKANKVVVANQKAKSEK